MDCQHEGCRCGVAEGESFCSDHCREHADHAAMGAGEHACECGHPDCVAA